MGRRISLDGTPTDYEEDTTIRQLKRDAGWHKDDIVVYTDTDGESYTVHDGETVTDIAEGATVSRQAADGKVFG